MVHQQQGADAVNGGVEPYCFDLKSDEQPFKRTTVIGEEWVSLVELGCWIKQCSFVVISNEEGKRLDRIPDADGRAYIAARVVRISGGHKVLPGRHALFSPEDLTAVRIRCLLGKAKVTLTVFPE